MTPSRPDGRPASSVERFVLAALLALLAATSFVTLERTLAPPLDAKGRPWVVEVVAEGGPEKEPPLVAAPAARDGRWLHARVPAGTAVRLRVRTEDGDTWWTSPEPFDPAEAPREGAIELRVVPVRGVARVGKQPLAGLATFTDGGGAKVGLAVDADGRFEGALPADGKWQVRAKSVRARFEKEMEVEVPRPETTRAGRSLPSFVDVHFPDLAIRGEVVDEEGRPVEGFTLWIGLDGLVNSIPWDYAGSSFRYDRVSLGTTYAFSVTVPPSFLSVPKRWSASYQIEVPPDDDPEYVRVVVRKWRPFHGHVVSTAGRPVRTAHGYLATVPGNGLDRGWITPRGPRAPFEGRVPVEAKYTCVVLTPRDLAIQVSKHETEGDDHEIVVRPDGGRLELTTPVDPLRVATLFHEGCAVRLRTLEKTKGATSWRGDEGLEVSLPHVEPGPWSLCLLSPGEYEAYDGEAPVFPLCAHGVLEAGGRLELKIPE